MTTDDRADGKSPLEIEHERLMEARRQKFARMRELSRLGLHEEAAELRKELQVLPQPSAHASQKPSAPLEAMRRACHQPPHDLSEDDGDV